jgi:nucleotide-binding universal stress UspA family protein
VVGEIGGRPDRVQGRTNDAIHPHGVEGFVSRQDGSLSLPNILIPVAIKPRPQPSVEAAARLIRNLQLPAGVVTLLHVGPTAEMPSRKIPKDTDWTWTKVVKVGEPVDIILQTATELRTDLIIMTSEGPDGFLDALRGTTSERVIRKARCPVAHLPVGSMLGWSKNATNPTPEPPHTNLEAAGRLYGPEKPLASDTTMQKSTLTGPRVK